MNMNNEDLKKVEYLYEKLENIGCLTFSTFNDNEIQSRIAHFNGYDEHGIYFRSMWNKPFAKQIIENENITVCGITDPRVFHSEENYVPQFPAGYFIRITGKAKFVAEEDIRKRAIGNKRLDLAVFDMDRYTAMRRGNFVLYEGKVEIYDFDFECEHRDHKNLRERFSFGNVPFNLAGPTITERCTGCGLCFDNCTFKAITPGSPYKIDPARCDDCGSCLMVCPADAIDESKPF